MRLAPFEGEEPWAIYNKAGDMVYMNMHKDEQSTWDCFLGWPPLDEIKYAKRRGLVAERVTVIRRGE